MQGFVMHRLLEAGVYRAILGMALDRVYCLLHVGCR